MKCELEFCIYNEKQNCILEEIELDSIGVCNSCEIVSIPENILKKHKSLRLEKIKKIWENYNNN